MKLFEKHVREIGAKHGISTQGIQEMINVLSEYYDIVPKDNQAPDTTNLIPIKIIVYDIDQAIALAKGRTDYNIVYQALVYQGIIIHSIYLLTSIDYGILRTHKNQIMNLGANPYWQEYYEILDSIYIQRHLEVTNDGRKTDIINPSNKEIFGE